MARQGVIIIISGVGGRSSSSSSSSSSSRLWNVSAVCWSVLITLCISDTEYTRNNVEI